MKPPNSKKKEILTKKLNCISEDHTILYLEKWLSRCGIQCFCDHDINDGIHKISTFQCNSKSRFDMIIISNKFNIALEIKNANNSSSVNNAFFQLLDYAKKNTNSVFMYPDKREEIIKIDGFAIATQYSKMGRLFKRESLIQTSKKEKYEAHLRGEIPIFEFEKTQLYSRLLWRGAQYLDIKAPIGILINNIFSDNPLPHIFMKKKKKRSFFESLV